MSTQPGAVTGDVAASNGSAVADRSQRELKRTRPIKACQSCRAKKVKCTLLPDEPTCEQCSASGKTCLFRVDDLCPTLRAERFSNFIPGANARTIASGNRKSSVSNRATGVLESEGGNKRRRTATTSPDDDAGDATTTGKAGGKSKAVFRSFANPSNLAAPSAAPVRDNNGHYAEQQHYEQGSHYAPMPYGSPRFADNVAQMPTYSGYGGEIRRGVAPTPQQVISSYRYAQPSPVPTHDRYAQPSMGLDQSGQSLPSFRSTFSGMELPNAGSSSSTSSAGMLGQNSYSDTRGGGGSLNGSGDDLMRRGSISQTSPSGASQSSRLSLLRKDFSTDSDGTLPSGLSRISVPQWGQPAGVNLRVWYDKPTTGYRLPSPGGSSSKWGASSSARSPSIAPSSPGAWPFQASGSSTGGLGELIPASSPANPRFTNSDLYTHLGIRGHHHSIPDSAARHSLNAISGQTGRRSTFSTPAPPTGQESQERPERRQRSSTSAMPGGVQADQQQQQQEPLPPVLVESQEVESYESEEPPRPTLLKPTVIPFFRFYGSTANTPGLKPVRVGIFHDSEDPEPAALPTAISVDENAATHASPAEEAGAGAGAGAGAASSQNGASVGKAPSSIAAASNAAETPREPFGPDRSPHAGESVLSSSTRELFETDRPRYPRKDILQDLVPLFIKHFKNHLFPWIDAKELLAQSLRGETSAILSNSICALAARFSTHPELRAKGSKAGEAFLEMAKVLLVPLLSFSSVEAIEILVLIAHAEFAAGADAGLWNFCGMALRQANDLGLGYESTIAGMEVKLQYRARWLFWSVVNLERVICWGTGRALSLREDDFDTKLPSTNDPSSECFVAGYIVQALGIRARLGELLNRRGDDDSGMRGKRLKQCFEALLSFYDSMPADLYQFSVGNFRKRAATNQGPAFVWLHVLLHSTLSVLNRPSLLARKFDDLGPAPPRMASIVAQATQTIVSILNFVRASNDETLSGFNSYLDTIPWLDQLVLPCGRSFLAERQDSQSALRRLGHQSRPQSRDGTETPAPHWAPLLASRQYADANLATCQSVLDQLALFWEGAGYPARVLKQESAGGTDDTDSAAVAQTAPIRDLELVLSWAKARAKRARAERTPGFSRRASFSVEMSDNASAYAALGPENETSPTGLGFSGAIDVESLLAAWVAQQPDSANGAESGEAQWTNDVNADPGTSFGVDLNAMQLEELFGVGEVSPIELLPQGADAALQDIPPELLSLFQFNGPRAATASTEQD